MYNETIARHYSAFRPPLHALILQRVLAVDEHFNRGLDIGCGTGYSAVALSSYCRHVDAIDPSADMLHETIPHQKISYLLGSADNMPFPDSSVDVVTFAGSLFYAKSSRLIEELKRVCRQGAVIIPYDFEVLLEESDARYGVKVESAPTEYCHETNFSGTTGFSEIMGGSDQVDLTLSAAEHAHILLSSIDRYNAFLDKYRQPDPFQPLVREISADSGRHILKVDIFYYKYRLDI